MTDLTRKAIRRKLERSENLLANVQAHLKDIDDKVPDEFRYQPRKAQLFKVALMLEQVIKVLEAMRKKW